MAEHLSMEEVAGIKEAFKTMDINNRGQINLDELRSGLQKLGQPIPDSDLQILMEAVSIVMCAQSVKKETFTPNKHFFSPISLKHDDG